ncbi:hypothetical protein ACMG4H_14165 [Corynebacterium glutamicum]|uniref:hypothetical protein n=1 Tax=Corynebacterium glutamicum TaxID=1718 RepID=UPI003C7CC6B1
MSLDFDALFEELSSAPQTKEAVRDKAEELREAMEMRWPRIDEVGDHQRGFLQDEPDRIIKITESTRSNRPTHVVTVRHPGAVAAQAKYSFVTKAVKDVS